jgi:hypothetical protein
MALDLIMLPIMLPIMLLYWIPTGKLLTPLIQQLWDAEDDSK